MAEAQKEILESIRDIIGGDKNASSDDDVLELTDIIEQPSTKPANLFEEDLAKPAASADNDILSEIDSLLGAAEEPNHAPITTADSVLELAEIAPQPEAEPMPTSMPDFTQEITENNTAGEVKMDLDTTEPLISAQSAANAEAALKSLVSSVNNATKPKIQSAPFRNGDTVEDMVVEMLKPMLKDWLDNNLPQIVQTIVEKEVKKLIPSA